MVTLSSITEWSHPLTDAAVERIEADDLDHEWKAEAVDGCGENAVQELIDDDEQALAWCCAVHVVHCVEIEEDRVQSEHDEIDWQETKDSLMAWRQG